MSAAEDREQRLRRSQIQRDLDRARSAYKWACWCYALGAALFISALTFGVVAIVMQSPILGGIAGLHFAPLFVWVVAIDMSNGAPASRKQEVIKLEDKWDQEFTV